MVQRTKLTFPLTVDLDLPLSVDSRNLVCQLPALKPKIVGARSKCELAERIVIVEKCNDLKSSHVVLVYDFDQSGNVPSSSLVGCYVVVAFRGLNEDCDVQNANDISVSWNSS